MSFKLKMSAVYLQKQPRKSYFPHKVTDGLTDRKSELKSSLATKNINKHEL